MLKKIFFLLITAVILISSINSEGVSESKEETMTEYDGNIEIATLGGGCFWCMEHPFEILDGVIDVVSGYAGGDIENPSYEEVTTGTTGHIETVQITFNSEIISYSDLLEVFWRQIDPTDGGGSFVDRGSQYQNAVFYHDDDQKKTAEASIKQLEDSGRYNRPIVTELREFTNFYIAEDYHQDYYKISPVNYKFYRMNSGRDQYRDRVWGDDKDYNPTAANYQKPSDEELKSLLEPLQYEVTQNEGLMMALSHTDSGSVLTPPL